MHSALALYGERLRAGVVDGALRHAHVATATRPQARTRDGEVLRFALERWLSPADATDECLLDGVAGPVLDVGCGPGRHLQALAARGVFALGVDLSPVAVELAVGGGGRAIVGDIFSDVPGAGTWQTALLLDGNIGIGGSPVRLLRRIDALLHKRGEVIVELEPPHGVTSSSQIRIEVGDLVSPWFAWARVAAPAIIQLARSSGFEVAECSEISDRWFARLRPHRTRSLPSR